MLIKSINQENTIIGGQKVLLKLKRHLNDIHMRYNILNPRNDDMGKIKEKNHTTDD